MRATIILALALAFVPVGLAETKDPARIRNAAIDDAVQKTHACQKSAQITLSRRSQARIPLTAFAYRRWVIRKWEARLEVCSQVKQERTIPTTGDWVTAVNVVQRVHPGTKAWLLSCSGGEGGHGGFKMNNQGSPAGGWMQFYRSTYESSNDTAFAQARSRGFIISERANSWFHPLGQALTAAYMRTHGGSSNWDPGIDPACR